MGMALKWLADCRQPTCQPDSRGSTAAAAAPPKIREPHRPSSSSSGSPTSLSRRTHTACPICQPRSAPSTCARSTVQATTPCPCPPRPISTKRSSNARPTRSSSTARATSDMSCRCQRLAITTRCRKKATVGCWFATVSKVVQDGFSAALVRGCFEIGSRLVSCYSPAVPAGSRQLRLRFASVFADDSLLLCLGFTDGRVLVRNWPNRPPRSQSNSTKNYVENRLRNGSQIVVSQRESNREATANQPSTNRGPTLNHTCASPEPILKEP